MKNLKIKNALLAGAAIFALTLTSCEKDDSSNSTGTSDKSMTKISMTDAPIDNSEVKAVFVTVTEIRLDGQTYDGFQGKKTFDISAMQNGNTQLLFDGELENKTYNEMEIDLDLDKDDQGNTPGSYIMTNSQTKLKLNSNSSNTSKVTLIVKNSTDVNSTRNNDFVVDLDLRKSIKQESNGDYSFVSNTELSNSLRLVNRSESNNMKGKINTSTFNNYDKLIAYIYVKGEFNKDIETKESGTDKITFRNAVSSSVVSESDMYGFHFLNDGNYELHLVGYDEKDGKLEMKTLLDLSSGTSIDLGNINLTGNTDLDLNISITGLLPL